MNSPYNEFRAHMRARSHQKALALADRELHAVQGRSEFWLTQRAQALLQLRDYGAAIAAANEALELAPTSAYALLARADAQRLAGNYATALPDFMELAHDDRVAKRARTGALQCLTRQGLWQQLLDCAGQWSAHLGWRAKALVGLKRWAEARQTLEVWLGQSPDHRQALWLLVDVEIAEASIGAVRDRYARLARLPSRPAIYREIHASLCRRMGDDAAAAAQYEQAAKVSSDPSIRRRQAFAMAKAGQEAAACDMFEELLRCDPADQYVHSAYLAACRRITGQERAITFYESLLELHPEYKGTYGRLRKIRTEVETKVP